MLEVLFSPKSVKEFKAVLDQASALVRQKNFDKAATLYVNIHNAFEAMPPEYQHKFEQDVDLLFKELTLYMRLNEAYILARAGSMAAFRRELDRIHDLTFELEPAGRAHRDVAVLVEFAKQNYEFFLDVYTYKVNASSFRKKVRHVRALVHKKQIHPALREYAGLLIIYNKVAPLLSYGRRLEFYETLKMLFKELSIQRLLLLAGERPKKGRVRVELPDFRQAHLAREPPEPLYGEIDHRYDELHALVKKGDLKKAFDVYAKITNERMKREPHRPHLEVKAPPAVHKPKRKRRKLLDQEYQKKFNKDYAKLHQLVKSGDFHTAKRLLKTLK